MKSKLDNIYYYIFEGIKCVFFVEWKIPMNDNLILSYGLLRSHCIRCTIKARKEEALWLWCVQTKEEIIYYQACVCF